MQESMKSLFERYRDDATVLKCERYARWTLPQLMVDLQLVQSGKTVQVERDFQEMGALLVNNLASKLAGLLFPNSRPFYKIKLGKQVLDRLKQNGRDQNDVATGLAKLEMESCQQLFVNASYEQLVLALKHLIVTGNTLIYRDSDKRTTHAYGLRSFGILRDGRGNMIDCVLREFTAFETLPVLVQQRLTIGSDKYKRLTGQNNRVELYTRIKRERRGNIDGYSVSQEADTISVGEEGWYPEHLCP